MDEMTKKLKETRVRVIFKDASVYRMNTKRRELIAAEANSCGIEGIDYADLVKVAHPISHW
jgi:hypothetical protein